MMSFTTGCVVILALASCCYAFPVTSCNIMCGPDTCKNISLECERGYLKVNSSMCGCCPSCIQYIGQGDECRATHVPPDFECAEGLSCSEKTGTCVPLDNMVTSSTEQPHIPCNKTQQSSVECSFDGSYAPRQCDAGWCYCVTPEGHKIAHYSVPVEDKQSMECVCARVEHALAAATKQRPEMCDKFGNYKQ